MRPVRQIFVAKNLSQTPLKQKIRQKSRNSKKNISLSGKKTKASKTNYRVKTWISAKMWPLSSRLLNSWRENLKISRL